MSAFRKTVAQQRACRAPSIYAVEFRSKARLAWGREAAAVVFDIDSALGMPAAEWRLVVEQARLADCAVIGLSSSSHSPSQLAALGFDALIIGPASTVYLYDLQDRRFVPDNLFRQMLSSVWNPVDVTEVLHRVYRIISHEAVTERMVFAGDYDSDFIISVAVNGTWETLQRVIKLIEEEMHRYNDEENACLCFHCAVAAVPDRTNEFLVSLMPELANPAFAVRYLLERFGMRGTVITNRVTDISLYHTLGIAVGLYGADLSPEEPAVVEVAVESPSAAPVTITRLPKAEGVLALLKHPSFGLAETAPPA